MVVITMSGLLICNLHFYNMLDTAEFKCGRAYCMPHTIYIRQRVSNGKSNFRIVNHRYQWCSQNVVSTRGGVEDTRLEAKAKDTKKIRGQGQGQPFRGQTLSRPRTGMLEAKDQGHKRKRSPKKKRSLQKFFWRSPQKNVFQKIFLALHNILTIQKIVLSSS